jgi:hypothetical protein
MSGRGFLAATLLLLAATGAGAESGHHWAAELGTDYKTCEGATTPQILKAASSDHSYLLANGFISCKDDGSQYVYTVDFLNLSINPNVPAIADRSALNLDWIGCVAFTPGADAQITVFYDEVLPLRASVKRTDRRVSIGKLTFRVPKQITQQAKNLLFYVTAEGLLFAIPLL